MILNISPERSFNTLLEYVEKRKTIFYDIIGQNALSIAQRRGVRAALYHTISTWYVCFVHKSCQYSDDDCLVNMSFNEELSASQSHKQNISFHS